MGDVGFSKINKGKQLFAFYKKLLLTFILLLAILPIYGQAKLTLKQLSLQDGLSQSTIYCMLQDSQGYIWIGTRDGLNKFDGYSFTVFKNNKNDSTSLSNNQVFSLLEDRDGKIWAGTGKGISVYDKRLDSFTRHERVNDDSTAFRSSHVYTICQDSRGYIWVGTDGGGVSIFDSLTGSFKSLAETFNVSGFKNNLRVRTIIELSNREVWIGTIGDGINIYNQDSDSVKQVNSSLNSLCGSKLNSVRILFEDSKGNVWIGSNENGLSVFDLSSGGSVEFCANRKNQLSHNVVRTIYEDVNGIIWIGTRVGLNRYDTEKDEFTYYFHDELDYTSLSNNSIRSILQDNNGNMWFGTYYGGLNILYNSSQNFKLFAPENNTRNSLRYEIVSSFAEDNKGNIWIGTEGGGINYLNTSNDKIFVNSLIQKVISDKGKNVKALFTDSKNNLWVGTYGGGLYIIDPATGKFQNFTYSATDSNSITSNNIYSIYIDSKGFCWIGTNLGGLNLFDLKTKTFKRIDVKDKNGESIVVKTINSIKEDSEGNLWFGTGRGLIKYDHKTYRAIDLYNNTEELLDNVIVLTVNIDSYQTVWVGTEHDGLISLEIDSEKTKQYTVKEGLYSNIILGVIEDESSNLWISTSRGLLKFPLSIHYDNTEGKAPSIIFYDANDGLQGNEFNRGASFKDSKGVIYFGGLGGFNSFNPEYISQNKTKAPVLLTAFYLSNKIVDTYSDESPLKQHISQTQKIKLKHNQSSFSFEFVALNFDKPHKNNYAYKLEGFDKEWIYAGINRKAVYTNIDPGQYKFKVKASNNDNLWNDEGTAVDIIVSPPFWKTKLAIVTYFLLVTLLLFGFRRLVIIRTNEKNMLEYERLEKIRIADLNQMKLRFFTNISHEFRTPLTLISGPLEKLLSDSEISTGEKKYLHALMHKNVLRMQRLITQLMDFRKLENKKMKLKVSSDSINKCILEAVQLFEEFCKQKEIKLEFISNSDEGTDCWFDKTVVDNIIFVLLSNAVKFTSADGTIKVEINLKSPNIEVQVSDTGIGIPEEKLNVIFERFYSDDKLTKSLGTGIGLSFAKSLVELHKGEIWVESVLDKGTTFTFSIPVDRHKFADEELEITQEFATVDNDHTVINNVLPPIVEPATEAQKESILIVEDNRELREFIKSSFKKYEMFEAENGKEGFKLAKKHLPDIIISDVMMPVMDGMEFCRLIKTNMITNHIPLILLTAKTKVENRLEGTQSGADIYMDKPFNVALLDASVKNLLVQRKNMRERFAGQFVTDNPDEYNNKVEDGFIKKVQEIIYSRKSDHDLRVEDLGSELGLSRSQLFRKFKNLTNHSPNEFIKVVRLKYSTELLIKGEYNINEISDECGFSSASHFIASFKKHYNKTPKEFALLLAKKRSEKKQ